MNWKPKSQPKRRKNNDPVYGSIDRIAGAGPICARHTCRGLFRQLLGQVEKEFVETRWSTIASGFNSQFARVDRSSDEHGRPKRDEGPGGNHKKHVRQQRTLADTKCKRPKKLS